MKNNNAIKTIERMNNIINEMKELRNEFESILNQLNNNEKELLVNDDYEDLDSYENLIDDDLKDLINEEYNEDEDPEYLAWVEANFGEENEYNEEDADDDDDDEELIYNIYFTQEQFETILENFEELPFGYVYNEKEEEYLVRMDEDLADEINDKLDYLAYIALYEEYYRAKYERIISVKNAIYYGTHYNM